MFRYAALLDEYGSAEVLIVGPKGGDVTEIALDDLEHAAGVLGCASLFGYSLLLSVEGGGDE